MRIRWGLGLLVASASGCSDPELEGRLQALEDRVAELEQRSQGGPAVPSATAAVPPVATPERENAAALVLRDAAQAIDALDWDKARAALETLRTEHGDTRAAKASARLLAEVEAVGKPEAELDVERWLTGSAAELGSGKATIYVFWEAWCSHCQRDLPRLAEIYGRNRGKGLRVVGVTRMSKGVTEEQALKFVADAGVEWPNAKDQGDTLHRWYNVTGIPAAAVVKDGKVVWRGSPHKLTDEFLARWL